VGGLSSLVFWAGPVAGLSGLSGEEMDDDTRIDWSQILDIEPELEEVEILPSGPGYDMESEPEFPMDIEMMSPEILRLPNLFGR
jgi:hypothetical protein